MFFFFFCCFCGFSRGGFFDGFFAVLLAGIVFHVEGLIGGGGLGSWGGSKRLYITFSHINIEKKRGDVMREKLIAAIKPILEEYCREVEKIVQEGYDREEEADWWEIDEEVRGLTEKFREKIERRLDLEVDGEVDGVMEVESVYMGDSGVGFEHKDELWHIASVVEGSKTYIVKAIVHEALVYGKFRYYLRDLWVEVRYTLGRFTGELVREVNWHFIRAEWLPSIERMIDQLARAEQEGKLEEELERVADEVKKGMWIYDYQWFADALRKVAEKSGLSVSL